MHHDVLSGYTTAAALCTTMSLVTNHLVTQPPQHYAPWRLSLLITWLHNRRSTMHHDAKWDLFNIFNTNFNQHSHLTFYINNINAFYWTWSLSNINVFIQQCEIMPKKLQYTLVSYNIMSHANCIHAVYTCSTITELSFMNMHGGHYCLVATTNSEPAEYGI